MKYFKHKEFENAYIKTEDFKTFYFYNGGAPFPVWSLQPQDSAESIKKHFDTNMFEELTEAEAFLEIL